MYGVRSIISSRVPSTRPRRPLCGNCANLNLGSDVVIDVDGRLWAVCFDVVENRVAVGLRKPGPLQPHRLACHGSSRLDGSGSTLGKMRLDFLVRDCGERIVQRFLHLGTEPLVMRGAV